MVAAEIRPGRDGSSARDAVPGCTPARVGDVAQRRGQRAASSWPGAIDASVPGMHLVVIDVEQPQPALLAERQPDHAAQLDQLGLTEVRVQAVPERVVGVHPPRDRLGVRERRLLPVVEAVRALEVEQLVVLALDEPLRATLARTAGCRSSRT